VTGAEMKALRLRLGLGRLEFARLIGYTGTDRNDEMRVKRYEDGELVPLYLARLFWLIEEFVRAHARLPVFPEWGGYEFEHSPDPQHRQQEDHKFY